MSTGHEEVLLEAPSARIKRGLEAGAEKGAGPPDGRSLMSHRPVILKLPFNIPRLQSVVTRKEVRGHTAIVEATTCSYPAGLIVGGSKLLLGEFFRGPPPSLAAPPIG
ncbi:hypothetical protein KM043_009250 [Ampulex compressa]|nr:hypothetical protein KM043_009250 [Ampulex compressa]